MAQKKKRKKAKKTSSSTLVTFKNPHFLAGKPNELPTHFDWTNPEEMRKHGWEIKTRQLDRRGRPLKKKRTKKTATRAKKAITTDFSAPGIANRVVSTLLLDLKTGRVSPGPRAIIVPGVVPGTRWKRTKRRSKKT